MSNEYAVTEDDLKGGGSGGNAAKPRGKYTGQIEKAESKVDAKKKIYLAFRVKITHGQRRNGVIFENWLTLNPQANSFQKARRNSFYKAIGLQAGALPYGVPGGPAVGLLDGTYVDVTIEHRFEQVPGQDYNIVTSKSSKSPWKTNDWENCVNDKGQLFKDPFGNVFDAPIDPKEEVTFYDVSDEFVGVGDPDATDDAPEPENADEEDWG